MIKMKSIQSMKWVALLALTTAAIAAQDSITIRRELKAGTTDVYKAENEVKQIIDVPSMGEQDILVTQIATINVKTLAVNSEKGTADVEALTKVEKSTTEGSLAAMMGAPDTKLPEPKTEKGTLDSRNRLVFLRDPKAKPAQGPGAMMAGMPGMSEISAQALLTFVELPEKPIKVGESVEVALPNASGAAGMGMKDVKMTIKLIGEKEVEGQKLLVLTYSGNMKIDIDPSKNPQASQGQGMKMSGTAVLSGEGIVDKATGKTISNLMSIKNDVKVFIEQAGMDIPVRGTITMKLNLVK